uniref:Uncharacterized protein n=1 Tax=Knipowitschia caucasica TaxID=637954 RepID=A0AAV2MLJ6_KNICA
MLLNAEEVCEEESDGGQGKKKQPQRFVSLRPLLEAYAQSARHDGLFHRSISSPPVGSGGRNINPPGWLSGPCFPYRSTRSVWDPGQTEGPAARGSTGDVVRSSPEYSVEEGPGHVPDPSSESTTSSTRPEVSRL